VVKEGDGFLAVEVDMKSKWCIVDSTFSSPPNSFGFSISTTERSLNLKKGSDPEDWTEVEIEGCAGWEIFSVDCNRYTVRLVIIRNHE
jgi:hypothetical protein